MKGKGVGKRGGLEGKGGKRWMETGRKGEEREEEGWKGKNRGEGEGREGEKKERRQEPPKNAETSNFTKFLPRDATLSRYMLSSCVRLSVRPSLRLSVCHTPVLYHNG